MKRRGLIYKIGVLIVGIIAISTAVILAAPNINLTGSSNGNTFNLSWTNSDTTSVYSYRAVRSVNGGAYNGLSATGSEKIKVLNIYPDVSPQITFTSTADNQTYTLPKSASLKMWMEQANSLDANGYGRGLITVTPVSLNAFNANPGGYLYKDASGKYNYDVIMYGTWDSNNIQDISAEAATVTQQYIDAGGAAIFGHDTICSTSPNFATLASHVNLSLYNAPTYNGIEEVASGVGAADQSYISRIKITKTGVFTTYPWSIGTEGTILSVPSCHTSNQNASGDVWLRYTHSIYTDADMVAPSNFYLTTYLNRAMIQTGHADCAATEDEQKIIANLIFYLADVGVETTATDTNVVDIDIPNVATLANNTLNGINGTATIAATDNGTTYKYYVEATEKVSQAKTTSNIVTHVQTSGVAGYSYVIDENATTDVDNTIDTTSTNINYTLGNGPKTYLHIKTIDNAGNVSGVTHILLHENVAPEMTLTSNITTWTNKDVVITAKATDTDGSVVSIKKPDASVANAATTTYTASQNGKYSFTATDNSGATVTKELNITWIDKVKPEGQSTGITQPTASNRYAVINFKATDDASGVAKIVLPDGKEVTSDTVAFNVTTPGTYTFKVVDVAGNEKSFDVPVTIVSDGLEVKFIDQVTNEEIATKQTKTGNIGDAYTTAAETVAGYELVKTPDNKNGNLTMDKITVTYEYRKNSNVTVRYIDSNSGLPIITDIVTKYKEGDTYTTEEKTFDGYKLVGKTNNTSGTVVRDDIGVTYQYKKISTGVDIKYIDQVTGNEIATTEHFDGLENDTYTTTAKTVDGYELVKTPTNKDGKLTVGLITVTYEYRKNSNVIVKYLDENYGTEIIQNVVTKYKEGDTYTTEEKLFDGYQLTSKTDNTSGTVVREDIVVEYRYKKVSAGVDTKFIDQVTGEEIETVVHQTGLEKDAYTTTPKTIDGYELVKTPENAKGNMTVDLITVTYEYRKNSNVTVKYIDENYNTNIIEDIVTKYKEGDKYTTEEKTFDGYQLTRKTDNTSGTVVRDNIEVVYYYKKISAGVDVKYIDQATGLNIADTEHLEGLEKDPYETEPKDIDDYILVFTPDNKDGEMVVELTEVVYEYRMLSDVTTKFIDENYGTEITEEVKQTYKQGDPYSTKAKNLDGYQLVGQTNNTNGMVEREDIVVEYKYKKISAGVETKYIDQVTKEEIATPTHQSGLEKDAYTTSAKDVAGYELVLTPDNKDGEMTVEKTTVTYEYRLVSKVTTKYIDVNSRTEIVTAVENNYKEGDTYTTEEKILEGYQLVGKSDNTSGTMGRSNIEVTYEYKKISNGIEVVYVDQVTGNPIAASVVKTGLENQEYTTEAKTIDGYELVTIPSNATGKMTVGKITIKYEYRKLSDVIAKYIDVNYNTEITQEVKQTLKEGDLYTTEEKSFEGYKLTSKTDNTSGVMARENIEVVYEYKKISAGVDVKFIDQVTGEEIADKEHQDGLEKDNYTTAPKTIENYELVKTPTNKNGEMTVELITVTYEYRLLSDVTTKHIDANTGKEIVDAVVETYKEGDAYATTAKDLVGYILTKSPEVPNGTMGREDIEVVYEYKMISDGLIVKYIDEITGDLLDMENYTGNENDMIQLEEKSFDKYILTKRPSVSEIKLTVEPQEVRFYYKKLIDINVIGIDAITGEEIYRKVQNGVEGEEYTTTPVILPGYEITKTPDNASGTYTREDVDVIYEYKRVSGGVIVTYVDKDTREILDSQTITGYVGEEYETDKKVYEKYDFVEVVGNPNGKLEVEQIEITYLYSKKTGEVEIVYVDTEGNELLKEELTGKVDEDYTIEIKDITNYQIKEVVGETEGQFTVEKQIIKFVMEKLRGKVIVNLYDQDGNLLGQLEEEDFVGEMFEVELPEKEGYYIDGENKVSVEYIDGEIIINVNYIKIPEPVEPPATGDINVVWYLAIVVSTSVVLVKKLKLQK